MFPDSIVLVIFGLFFVGFFAAFAFVPLQADIEKELV